jgi:N-acetylneuraminic acid mutarotase
MRQRTSAIALLGFVATAIVALGWPSVGAGSSDGIERAGAAGLQSYAWKQVNDEAPWTARAGLQSVKLGGKFYVMGGRTPASPLIPFASVIFDDIWRSGDKGASWKQVTDDAPWPARAYFEAVTKARKDGKGKELFVLGGQNFDQPSDFFNDVWRSRDGGKTWKRMTESAPWEGRAGLSAVVRKGKIYVLGGGQGDDAATGGTGRTLYNDVWKSSDGRRWVRATGNAPWAPRAGAATVVKDGWIYLLGGEDGFICDPARPDRCPPYFNDVWRSKNGSDWKRVTRAAGWSKRPGHKCGVIDNRIVCFGGFGLEENPIDMWSSKDGSKWKQLNASPWDATTSEEIKYDFDVLVAKRGESKPGGKGCAGKNAPRRCAIFTFGGDRERFDLPPQVNFDRIDNDVWRFSQPR